MASSEHGDQAALVAWLKMTGIWDKYGCFAVPNGIPIPAPPRTRAKIVNHMKAEGMRPGAADLFIPAARGGYFGAFIEMKRRKGGVLSDEQREFLAIVEAAGYYTAVPRGYDDALELVQAYLSWPATKGIIMTEPTIIDIDNLSELPDDKWLRQQLARDDNEAEIIAELARLCPGQPIYRRKSKETGLILLSVPLPDDDQA